jgi:tetratricopeptide (TPR) repeat protein
LPSQITDAQPSISRYNLSARTFYPDDTMKHLAWIAWILLLAAAVPSLFAANAKKITVAQLQDLLSGFQHDKKSDAEVAAQLKQMELTDELTTATMNSMASLVPGPLSTEQMYVLEARSSILAPPDTDLPKAPSPDAAAQQAMLAKAADFASKTYPQLPHLTAGKMTARFQDGVEATPGYGGMHAGMSDNNDPIFNQASLYVRLMNSHTSQTESDHGIEKIAEDKTKWGPNGMVASVGPVLTLKTAVQEIMANGNPTWLRWETVNGIRIAVYTFAVDKKKAHFSINYCCFPDTDTVGTIHYSATASASGTHTPGGNLQNSVDWKNFKTSSGYHGELFVDPNSGTIVRLITEADLKPTDFVHYEDIRTDYAPMPIGGKTLVVPIRSFTLAEVVPNGDANAARVTIRHQFVTEDFKSYLPDHATSGTPADEVKPLAVSSSNKLVKEINTDVVAARTATREKRYADAETIMLKDTASQPDLILPWVELGLAQLGLKKYPEAEASFKAALVIDPRSPKAQHEMGFDRTDIPNATHITRRDNAATVVAADQTHAPEVTGIIDSSLGEIYIRSSRAPEAEAAFDAAAQANPAQAGFYLRNETIFFFQSGNTDAQLRAAEKAIAADPNGATPYYFKGQALVSKATVNPASQKLVLPPACANAYQKYLELEPNGQFSADAKSILASAGLPAKSPN